ncbi:decarboxylase, partial [Anaerotignum faecicola]|nr:decarboxylase [Anaerotignum faecicola]
HEMMAFGGRLERIRQQLMEMECLTLVDGVKGRCHVFDVDRSKIVVSVGKSGLTGPELQERLRREYRLEMEMCGPDYVTAITTVADTDEGLERLCRAFMEIDLDRKRSAEGCENSAGSCVGKNGDNAGERSSGIVDNGMEKERVCGWPEIAMTIAQAMDAPGQPVPLDDCEGLVSKEFIYIYPPG